MGQVSDTLTYHNLSRRTVKKRVIRLKVDRRWHDACISYETEIDAAEFEMVYTTHYHSTQQVLQAYQVERILGRKRH